MRTKKELCIGSNKCILGCPTHANDVFEEERAENSVIAASSISNVNQVDEKFKMQQEINEFAVQTKFDLVALIDVSARTVIVHKTRELLEEGFQAEEDFDTSIIFSMNTLVHPEDIEIFKQQLFDCLIKKLNQDRELKVEYRILDKNSKSYRWKRVLYRYFEKNNQTIIQLIEDIHDDMLTKTELEDYNQKLILQQKCFRTLSEYTNKVVFEWDFETKKIIPMSNFNALFGEEDSTINSEKDALSVESVHEEDQEVFSNIFKTILSENAINDVRFRIKDSSGIYHWCSLSGVVLKDNNGNIFKSIGILESIAEQIKKENVLREKAESDQLTGLYNKITSEFLIKESLDNSSKNNKHALIIIDIDNYKNINNKLGHLYGDIVLSQLATSLKTIFRKEDIIGRLGGDEFFVFIKDYANKEVLIKKAKAVCKVFHKTYSEGEKHESISASIGIALYPQHGKTFEQLYKNADVALYSVKMGGKNDFKIYTGETDSNYVSEKTDIDNTGRTKNRFKENRVEYIFRSLYESDDINKNINLSLQFITEHFGFSRGYIFETDNSGLYTNNTFEWCAEGITPEIENLQQLPIDLVSTAHASFKEKAVFITKEIKTMPEAEREILEQQNIKSMFQFGIMKDEQPIGFIGFDDCVNERMQTDDEVEELKLICNVFATFLTKQRATELAQNNNATMNSILNNFEGYSYVVDSETYKVVFENANTRNVIGTSSIGKCCYKAYMNKEAPCEECPIFRLSDEDDRNTVEIDNKQYGIFSRVSVSKLDWINGKNCYIISSIDVTEYKNHVQVADQMLHELLSLTKIGSWEWNFETGEVIYSDTWAEILGYTKDELLPTVTTWENMVLPEDLDYANMEIERHIRGETPIYESEFRMIRKDGTIIWAQDKGYVTQRDENGNVLSLLGVIQDISRIKNTEILLKENQEQLNKLAYYDELTDAPNLAKFKIEAHKFIEENKDKNLLLVKFDIQKFKLVNQILGQSEGDRIIVNVAKALKESTEGKYERYARLHDDEFLVLYIFEKPEDVPVLNKSFQSSFQKYMGKNFSYSIKIISGCYYMSDDNCFDLSQAIERANIAHKIAKETGCEITVYDKDFINTALKQKEIESKAEKAIEHYDFKVYLQPQYELENETIVGVEALVRWIDGDTIIFPDEFISLFEQNGFIIQLDFYMFEESCKIIREWLKRGITPIPISVNFSRRHFFDTDFVSGLAAIADKYHVPYRYLEIELTETTIMNTSDGLSEFIESLHAYGFQLSIDDFGTGYSSLGMLKNLNIDVIKLDRSFFVDANKNEKTHSILSNVLNLVIDLGIKTIAEGVEEKAHVDLLRKLNCDIIQGFYYGKPIPSEEFTAIIQKNSLTPAAKDQSIRFNLRKNNELLTDMMDSMPLAFTLWNKSLKLVQCNKEAANLVGLQAEEELIAEIEHTMPEYQPDGRCSMDVLTEHIRYVFETGDRRCASWFLQHHDGTQIPCEINFVRIVNKGEFMVACYARDISLQVKTQNMIKQEYTRLKVMMDTCPLCFNLWDENMKNSMCNKAAVELFEVESEEEYLFRFSELSPEYQPDGRLSSEKAIEKIKQTLEMGGTVFEWMHQKVNGDKIPTEITLVRTELNGKQVVAGFTRDLRR